MISPGLNLVMTVIGFGVSTMFIVFVCTRLICARIQLRASTRSFARSDLSIMERGVNGLEPVVVSSFPTKFVDQLIFGQDIQCAVCLSEYQEKDMLHVLPYCGHAFHAYCIDTWLKHNWTCPVCRISLRNSPDRRKMRPLVRENFVSDDFLADSTPDSVRVNDSLCSIAEVNCSAEIACSFGSRMKQMDNPLDS